LHGRDKGLITLGGRPLTAWVLDRLRPQVADMVISANRNLEAYAALACPVVADTLPGQPGPLAGILAAAALAIQDWLLVAPCDTPFLPADLAARMLARAEAEGVRLVRAADAERIHYAVMLLHRSLLPELAASLASGERSVRAWQARHPHTEARFDARNAFLNVNTEDDLRRAEAMLAAA
jgi:molybdopterin-guanine dinucleotide biosynthesis protein A